MSKRTFMSLVFGSIVLSLSVVLARSYAGENVDRSKVGSLGKTATNGVYRWFLINNLFNYYSNTGDGSINPNIGNSGFEFPKGTGNGCTFEDGIVWGGFHKGRSIPKVGGSTYSRGLQAGAILTPGGPLEANVPVADDPTLVKYRVYMVRPDVTPTTPFANVKEKMETDAALINRFSPMTAQGLYDIFVQDWNEWPAKDGAPAPYKDVDGNGVYNPAIDIPGQFDADQTLYYVANDCNATTVTSLYGSPTIGLEMHRTVWGYNLSGALGNTVFESTLLINKSGAPLDSTFMVQWADVDDGDGGDDYTGVDVSRSLGYTYNGKSSDQTYGIKVPAVGYNFFQGPILNTGNPSDSAVFRLKRRYGAKNLGLTTFVFFINGNATYADPGFGTGGDIEWYRLMNGLISSSGAPFINPKTNLPTKFTLDGDPVSGTGWIDGVGGLVPGDRRQCMVTGPFTLANGDTQEVVVAHIAAVGADRISSIAVLRWYSDLAQTAYNNLFNIPFPPPTPRPSVAALDREIALSWVDTSGVERFNSNGYAFEGYNVYQFTSPSADITQAIRLVTYDLANSVTTIFDDVYDASTGYVIRKPVEFGFDSGIKRTYETKVDAIGPKPLANGTPYYFGVTSYSFKPGGTPSHLESAPNLITIIPQSANPGYVYATVGDTIKTITHTNSAGGLSDGLVIPTIVNPTQLKGASYKVTFVGTPPNQVWNLVRTLGASVDTVAKNLRDQTGGDAGSVIVDGIQWSVIGAPNDFKGFVVTANASGPLVPFEMGAFGFNGSGFPLYNGEDRPADREQVGPGLFGIQTGNTGAGFSYANFLSRTTRTATGAGGNWPRIIPFDFEIRFTATGSKAEMAFTTGTIVDVPFELWNIGVGTPTNTADDVRLIPWINDVNGNDLFGLDSVDHPISGGDNDPETDWIYWYNPANTAPGAVGYNAWVASGFDDAANVGSEVMARMVLVNFNGGSISAPTFPANVAQQLPETGTVFRILTTKPNQPSDLFVVTTPAYSFNSAAATADVKNVNVFPNPYIGFNPLERNKYERFVTFSHLPVKATIRVFNLAGVLVRTIRKDSPDQFLPWDLKNESGYPVGAGMYIVYIDMPDLGTSKTLKLGVIPEQQYLDRW